MNSTPNTHFEYPPARPRRDIGAPGAAGDALSRSSDSGVLECLELPFSSRGAALGNKVNNSSALNQRTGVFPSNPSVSYALDTKRTKEEQEARSRAWANAARREARREHAARTRGIRHKMQMLIQEGRDRRNGYHFVEDRDLEPVTSFEKCGRYLVGGSVEVTYDEATGMTGFDGLHSCNRRSCPRCGQEKSKELLYELKAADREAKRLGLAVAFITSTFRHRRGNAFERNNDDMMYARSFAFSGRWYQKFKKRWGVVGHVRVNESPWSAKNGWHNHIHELWYFEAALSPDKHDAFQSEIEARWIAALASVGRTAEGEGIALRVDWVNGANALSEYLSKMSGDYVQEMSGADKKVARSAYSFMPSELAGIAAGSDPEGLRRLANACTDGIEAHAILKAEQLWVEYFYGVEGRRLVEWSHGLRKLLQVEEGAKVIEGEERAEREAAGELVPGRKLSVGILWPEDWDSKLRDDMVLQAQICAQEGDAERIGALLAKRGVVLWKTGYVIRDLGG